MPRSTPSTTLVGECERQLFLLVVIVDMRDQSPSLTSSPGGNRWLYAGLSVMRYDVRSVMSFFAFASDSGGHPSASICPFFLRLRTCSTIVAMSTSAAVTWRRQRG